MKLTLRIEKEDIRTRNSTTGMFVCTQLMDILITTEALDELFLEYELKRKMEEESKKKG